MNNLYKKQVALLIRIMPSVYRIKDFAVHGGTAINLFHKNMHGVPLMMAPDYQTDIPFLVWTSDNAPAVKETDGQVSHYHVFHSILKFYGMETPFYDESKNIFK